MKIIITGSAGLVGSNFIEYILSKEHNVEKIYAIDNLSGGYKENLPLNNKKLKFMKLDLTNKCHQKKIEKVFKKNKIDYIFHFAAYAAEGLSPFIRQFNYTTNIIPTAFLINMGIKYNIKRFIFTSSMATYGTNNVPYDEDMVLNPIDPYGISKYACEMDLKVAYEQHGMEYCIIVPHNIYGKYQNIWDPYRNVLGIWMYQSLHNLPMTIYGDGTQTRAFTYIEDILPCLWNSAIYDKCKNQRINLGGKYEISLNEAIKIMSRITGNTQILYTEARHEIKNAWCKHEKSEQLLDYVEKNDLTEGIIKMWDWANKQKDRKRIFFKNYELDKNIYSFWKFNNIIS